MFGRVLEADGGELVDDVVALYVLLLAQLVERGVAVAQFHVDDAEKHHGVVWKLHFSVVCLRFPELSGGWHFVCFAA